MIHAILNDLDKIKDSKLIVKWKNIILMNLNPLNEIKKEDVDKIIFLIKKREINCNCGNNNFNF